MILLTRALDDSQKLAKKLSEHGFKSFIEPMFKINFLLPKKKLSNFDTVLLTSKNALSPFKEHLEEIKPKKLIAVGKSTTKQAQDYGITNILVADANARDLTNLVLNNCSKNEKIYYPRAQTTAYDIKKILTSHGFNLTEEVVYKTLYKKFISKELSNALLSGKIKTAIFYSQKTIDNFFSLLDQELKKTITDTKIIVPFNCKTSHLGVLKVTKFIPDEFNDLLSALK